MTKLKFLLFALLLGLGLAAPAHAQYASINGTPTMVVPGYGMTIRIEATDTAVGSAILCLEQHADGWYGFHNTNPEFGTLADSIKSAGGPKAYILAKLPELNAAIANRFPPIGGTAGQPPAVQLTGEADVDSLNQALAASFKLQADANGKVTLVSQ